MPYFDVLESIYLNKHIFEQFDQFLQLVFLTETLQVYNGDRFIKGMGEKWCDWEVLLLFHVLNGIV